MNIDLFFSGAPSDNEWFPKKDNLNYCSKFFSYTESQYSIDYEVEVLPESGCSYYTYMRHKGVAGYDRENSYFAMTVKITDGYCADIIGLYHLLDTTFRNWIVGTIITQTPTGEKFLVRSLASVEETRKSAEEKVVSGLQLMINKLHAFDKSFAASRQQQKIGIASTSSFKNEQLIQELKLAHKLHLISDSDMAVATSSSTQEKMREYETKLKGKDNEINAAKKAQKDAESAKSKAEKALQDYKNELSKDPTERRWQSIRNDIADIKESLAVQHANTHSTGSRTPKKPPHIHDTDDVKRLLPWILFSIATIALILCLIWRPQSDSSDVASLKEKIQQYEKEKTVLNSEVERLKEENDSLAKKVNELQGKLNKITTVVTSGTGKAASQNEQLEPSYIDVKDISNGCVKLGTHRVIVKSKQGKKEFPEIEWTIEKGHEFARKEGENLVCISKGDVLLKAMYNNKAIVRPIKIVE